MKRKRIVKGIMALVLSLALVFGLVPVDGLSAVTKAQESMEITDGLSVMSTFEQSETVDGVKITVTAEAGIFPEGAELSVSKVSKQDKKVAEESVSEERDEQVNVAVSYTFDIKVLDKDGNEIQPADEKSVQVSFAMAEIKESNLETQVYHISENKSGDMKAEKLTVETNGDTATAETDGFSLYTVEFTYNDLQYVLNGDSSIELSEILDKVGLTGEVSAVEVSDESLLSADNENGEWVVTAHKAFSTTEWMKVSINGVVYEITVTDTQNSVSYIDASGTTQTCESYTALTTETTWTGWYVVSGDVTIDTRIIVSGEAHLILCDGATLTAGKGIAVNGGNSLTIYGQSGGTGKLTATGKEKGHAGIGGNSNSAGGTITINGGMVTANGGESGAGIGGGWVASGGTVTINGGMVTANGGKYGAGIGGGGSGNGGTVTITDGVVTARGGRNGAGIGGGDLKNGGTTIITGGTVTANGGDNGKGIGCGISGSGGTTTISLTSANDSIYANSYSGSVSVAQGKALWNGSETLSGTLSDLRMVDGKTLIMSGAYFISVSSPATGRVTAPTAALPGSTVTLEVIPNTNYSIAEVRYNDGTDHTITPVNDIYSFVMPAKDVTVSADFSFTPNSADISVSGDVYIIHTAAGWDMFCDLLTVDTLNGKTVKLADDFNNAATPVTSMAGTSDHRFKGTFDGNGNTLTVNLNASTDGCAPFGSIEGATIQNLTVAGSITTSKKYAASIAAHTYGETNIINCHSTVTITGDNSGDGTHGGFVSVNESGGTLSFSRCSFKGKMLGESATSNGGFVGYNSGTQINYTDCLFAPTEINMSTTSSCTFNRNGKNSFTRAYYAQAFGTAEGTLVYTSAPAGVTTEQVTAADGQTYYYEIDRRITSASEWNSFAEAVNGGNTFSGKTVVLGADIEVSTMVGTENNKFNGTFDGGGHTITFNLTDAPQHTALFAYVNGATIQNLNVAGAVSSSTDHIAVLISEPSGTVRVTDVTIGANISGTTYCGGFSTGGTGILFTRCVYNGKINASNNSGGFCGWGTNTTTLTDCIFAPTEGSSISGGGNFCNNTVGTVTRSYYTLQVGTSTQGKMAYAAVPNNTVYGALTVAGTTVYPPVAINGVKSSYIATGSNIHPEPTVTATDGTVLTKGTHYTVTYSQENDAAAGNYTLTVTGVSPYSGSQIISYEVKSVNLNITSDTQWNQFAENVNNGEDYDGVTVTLGNNIAVSTMVGTSDHRFKGTFDGGTHTITFTKADATTDNCAPFGYIEGATIKDLNIAGSITTTAKCAASIAAHTYGTTSITNCHSTVNITGNITGDGTHGGFVAVNESGGTLNFSECSFKGSMLGNATSNGGFVGYNSGTKINYTDCLFAPTEITMSTTSSCTFNRNGKNSFTRAYYTQTFGTAEGNKVYTSAPAGTITEQVIVADGSSYYMVTGWQTISVIASADDWRAFADSVNIGNVDYSGVTVTLGADISASTMAGTSSNPFKGTFDGGGHTLTLSLTNDGSECTAPFRYVNGATITMLRTAGTVNGGSQKFATGLIGKSAGTVNITACRSSVQITSSISDDATCGGFIGGADGTVTFANCLFDGSITGANATNCGGFVGWRKGTLTFNNCLMAGTMSLSSTSGSATFNRNGSATITKCYYRTAYGDTQGEAVGSTTNETLIDSDHLGSSWEISGESVVPVMGKKTIVLATVSGLYRNYLYTGNEISISYTVTDGNTELVKGTDYTETITKGGNASNVQEKGDYTLTISGIGNYRGTRTFRFTVRDAIEYRDSDGTTKTVNPQEVTAITEDNKPTTLSAGWYFVQESTTISSRITVSGSVNLILGDGTTLTVPKGIRVEGSNSLTIYGQSAGNGALTINGVDYYNAGIGGNNNDSSGAYNGQDAGNITIHGGIITVTGGQYGAGIGGGGTNGKNRSGGSGGNITIDGGTVTAYGNTSAAIGGGGHGASSITGGSGGNITISGGKVTAHLGFSGDGQGIGGCFGNSSGSITLRCTNADDFIQSSSYVGTVTVANGVTLYDDAGHAYTGTLDDTQKSAIVDKMGLGYAVSISFPIAHGTVAADKAGVRAAAENKTVTLTVTPDTGYHTDTVSYNDGSEHTITAVSGVYSFTMSAADVTSTATFAPNTYTVKFNGNGATSGSMSDQSFTYDETAKALMSNTYARTGYDFAGWARASNGTVDYMDGQSVQNLTAENDVIVTLYAQWTPYNYTVRFNGNGATDGSMNNQSFTYDTVQKLNTNGFTHAVAVTYEYNNAMGGNSDATGTSTATFNGWATSADGAVVYNDGASVNNLTSTKNGTFDLYAKWTDGGVTLPTPTKTGSTFGGWYSDESFSDNKRVGDGGATYTPTADITLYAKWTENDYSITVSNGIEHGGITVTVGETNNAFYAHYGDTVTLTVTPDIGYVIDNVIFTPQGGTVQTVSQTEGVYSFTMPADNITVNATFRYADNIGAQFYGYSLSLSGNIGVNFYMELDDSVISDDTAFMRFTLPSGTSDVYVKDIKNTANGKETIGGKTYYIFRCEVNAMNMTYSIKAQMHTGTGENEKIGTEYSYSVKDYADYLVEHKNDKAEFKNAVPVVKAMLNYGAYSQVYFNHATDALANANADTVAESEKDVSGVTADTINKPYSGGTDVFTNVSFAGVDMVLRSETVLRMYFNKKTGSDLTVTASGGTVEQSGETIMVSFANIKSYELDKDFTVTLSDGTNSGSISYCPLTYCYNVLKMNELNGISTEKLTALKNVVRSLYLYNKAANEYFKQ